MRDPQDGWGRWPDKGDPIGVASARLLALGLDRGERMEVLRFLGILLDHAAPDGSVRAEPAVIAGEFRLSGAAVDTYIDALRRVDVVSDDGSGLRIRGYEHHRSTGLPDGEALALIAGVLAGDASPAPDLAEAIEAAEAAEAAQAIEAAEGIEAEAVEAGGADTEPVPAPVDQPIDLRTPSAPPVTGEPGDAELPAPAPEPVLVGAATGPTGAAGPAPESEPAPTGRRLVPFRLAGRRPPVTSALALLTGLVLVLSGVFARPGSVPVDVTDLAAGPVTTIEVPTTLPRSVGPSISTPTASPPAPADAPADGPAAAPAPPPSGEVAASATAPADDELATPVAPVSCPELAPEVARVTARVEPAELNSLLAASPWIVVVEGAVLAGAEAATVSSLPVRVALADGSQITGEAIASPVTIEPGRVARWEVRAQTASIAAPEVRTVTAGPPLSSWVDETLAAACPIG